MSWMFSKIARHYLITQNWSTNLEISKSQRDTRTQSWFGSCRDFGDPRCFHPDDSSSGRFMCFNDSVFQPEDLWICIGKVCPNRITSRHEIVCKCPEEIEFRQRGVFWSCPILITNRIDRLDGLPQMNWYRRISLDDPEGEEGGQRGDAGGCHFVLAGVMFNDRRRVPRQLDESETIPN